MFDLLAARSRLNHQTAPATSWDPANKDSHITLSNANLTFSGSGSFWACVRSVDSHSTGKHRAELTLGSMPSGFSVMFGVGTSSTLLSNYAGSGSTAWSIWGLFSGNSELRHSGSGTPTSPGAAVGDVIAWYIDFDAGNAWAWTTKIGFIGGGDPNTNTSPTFTFTANTPFYLFGSANTGESGTLNAGQSTFSSPAKTGYVGW